MAGSVSNSLLKGLVILLWLAFGTAVAHAASNTTVETANTEPEQVSAEPASNKDTPSETKEPAKPAFKLKDNQGPVPLTNQPAAQSDSGKVVRVIVGLMIVVATILLLAVFYKRMNLGFPGSRAIKVVTTLPLGTRERVVVIEINGQQHLLGVTANQINHLTTLEEPLSEAAPALPQNTPFDSILKRMMKK